MAIDNAQDDDDDDSLTFASLLPKLTLEEKVKLISGYRFNAAPGILRLHVGVPPIKVADSINGIRPSDPSSDATTACFPSTTCLASTWDVELLGRLGEELAWQARSKGAQVVLGPTINIHRDPRGGRNFECFSEDPLLSGLLAGAIVNGIQRHGIGACPKHFVGNDSETMRHYYNVAESLDGRTMREIYLAAWEHLLRVSDPVAIMMAYNKVDGVYCCENRDLITKILRDTWGFKGITMSDWFAIKSTTAPIKAGLDLEMPFPIFRGSRLLKEMKSGTVTEADIDPLVSRMLGLRDRIRFSSQEVPADDSSSVSEETNQLALELAASGMVLLRNDNNILPLDVSKPYKITVIGEFATGLPVAGGGSASCTPQYTQNPLELLREYLPNATITRHPGVKTNVLVPVAPASILLSPTTGSPGVDVAYCLDPSSSDDLIHTETLSTPHISHLGPPFPVAGLTIPGSHIILTTTLTPCTTGIHTLAVRASGRFTLFVNDKLLLSGDSEPDLPTEQFIFNPRLYQTRTTLSMTAAELYQIKLTVHARSSVMESGEPTPYIATFCFEEASPSLEETLASAKEVASKADLAVIFAGRSPEHESEGFDLVETTLPGGQDELIRAVAGAAGRTVVVLCCGNPVDVEAWATIPVPTPAKTLTSDSDSESPGSTSPGSTSPGPILSSGTGSDSPGPNPSPGPGSDTGSSSSSGPGAEGIILAHFPGQEGARALAEILTGHKSPGGRLATTWWRDLSTSTGYRSFPAEKKDDGNVLLKYNEGVGVGYRGPGVGLTPGERVRWPFGFGLTYTEFRYEKLEATVKEGMVTCSVEVKNVGKRQGVEVIQLYVLPTCKKDDDKTFWRSEQELKAFKKVEIKKGETVHVVMEVEVDIACRYWDETEKDWRVDPGQYGVKVGDLHGEFVVGPAASAV